MSYDEVTRRKFLAILAKGGLAASMLPGMALFQNAQGAVFNFPADSKNLSEDERIHLPKVTLPPVVEDGSQAPIVVEMDHPMDADHYIKSIQLLNFDDPVVIKGKFYFTPANGEAFIGTQIRLAGGEGTVWVVAECNHHGRWAVSKTVKVAAGGC